MMTQKNKYSLTVEGMIEQRLVTWLKTDLLKSKKKSNCKHHRIDNCHGTIRLDKIKDRNCCVQIILKDTDDIDPKKYENKKSKNNILILSNPSIEIVLYAIFNCTDSNLDNKTIERKLNEKLKDYNIIYKHNLDSLNKILDLLQKDIKLVNRWIENLKKLNESNKSNFYELIEYFKEEE